MTQRRAIDVVLLPDRKVEAFCYEANRLLRESQPDDDIRLGPESALPHLSLAMGVIEFDELEPLCEALVGVVEDEGLSELSLKRAGPKPRGGAMDSNWLFVEKDVEIQTFHEAVMDTVLPFLRPPVRREDLHPSAEGDQERTLQWIDAYAEQHAGEGFRPHITLGRGKLPADMKHPEVMAPRALAVAWLGTSCTCPEILAELELDEL